MPNKLLASLNFWLGFGLTPEESAERAIETHGESYRPLVADTLQLAMQRRAAGQQASSSPSGLPVSPSLFPVDIDQQYPYEYEVDYPVQPFGSGQWETTIVVVGSYQPIDIATVLKRAKSAVVAIISQYPERFGGLTPAEFLQEVGPEPTITAISRKG